MHEKNGLWAVRVIPREEFSEGDTVGRKHWASQTVDFKGTRLVCSHVCDAYLFVYITLVLR